MRRHEHSADRASAANRTLVIVLAQVVVIVALLVVWSLARGRGCCASAETPGT